MPDLKQQTTIQKPVSTGDDLDYDFLRQKGLEYIESLAGQLWTDYNTHDPGITTLEMLCYAITDLGARIKMPLQNILAPQELTDQKLSDQFFRASEILPSDPVSEADYRRLFIDIDGVKNCWLRPYKKTVFVDCKHDKLSYNDDAFSDIDDTFKRSFDLQGLYTILVDVDNGFDSDDAFEVLKERIKARYHANRNLCEDLIEVKMIGEHPVSVCADIELEADADEESVHAHIKLALQEYFSPSMRFYGLRQMQEKGYATDRIFEGPVLEHGFIDPEELDKSGLRTEVRLSDIIQLIMAVKGVKVIKEISLNNCLLKNDDSETWVVCIDENKKPALCEDSTFSYFKGVLPLNINKKRVDSILNRLQKETEQEQMPASNDKELKLPAAKYSGAGETTTIQNDFPDTYGIGLNGLPSRAGTKRRSQALQFKGYLLFFDQILAGYFAHLGKVKDLLSVDNRLRQTYFTQAVQDIKDFKKLVDNYPKSSAEELTKLLFKDADDVVDRKNRILDHLTARFAERFNEYAFLMKVLYGQYAGEITLQTKERFLKHYPETSSSRGSGFDYYFKQAHELWNTENVSGVQKRIARLTGIKNVQRRNLSESFIVVSDPDEGDSTETFNWQISDAHDTLLLSSGKTYKTRRKAEMALYKVVILIMETPVSAIEAAFDKPVANGQIAGNFSISLSDGKYSFQIVNSELEKTDSGYILATHPLSYTSQDNLKTAMTDIIRFMITEFTEEGIYLVEHILLRPDVTRNDIPEDQFYPVCTENCESCDPVDPYSYRVSVILPGWTYRFSNAEFRTFMEEQIRRELPAHVLSGICWVGYRKNQVPDVENDLLRFEKAYRDFLLFKTNHQQEQDESVLKALTDALMQLNSIYPEGKLMDCNDDTTDDDDDDSLEGRIILGRTNIGNL
ncbi:hypothetical protein [Saccharicrinis sp. FJH54]|uniref:hypothetical protein n=1 Tax=Saccharicrinis sp. FJH54 TaxID=3344665 RepID=UPI0035D465AF